MWRRDLFTIFGGVLFAPFLPRPPLKLERDVTDEGFVSTRLWVEGDPKPYRFGFTGFKPCDEHAYKSSRPKGQILWRGNVEANAPRVVRQCR